MPEEVDTKQVSGLTTKLVNETSLHSPTESHFSDLCSDERGLTLETDNVSSDSKSELYLSLMTEITCSSSASNTSLLSYNTEICFSAPVKCTEED